MYNFHFSEAVGSYAENRKIITIRKVYQVQYNYVNIAWVKCATSVYLSSQQKSGYLWAISGEIAKKTVNCRTNLEAVTTNSLNFHSCSNNIFTVIMNCFVI